MAMNIGIDPFAASVSYVEPLQVLMINFDKTEINDPMDGLIKKFEKQVSQIYLKPEETLIDFLTKGKDNSQEVMLCPGCSAVFDKSAAKAFKESEKKIYNRRVLNSVGPKKNFKGSFVPCANTPTQSMGWRLPPHKAQSTIRKKPEFQQPHKFP
ncbi:Retrovirus-related Pol polyprotein from transposon opus [Sesbania bispinosa]|nr:Retrovirus-related Pol polyprotein from transposon opus [Sesbania bispinosa]